jgi:tetratricopeptide (TPR) repeat protein
MELAARFALAVAGAVEDARVAIATVKQRASQPMPVADAVAAALRLVERTAGDEVVCDALTASLVGGRFDCRRLAGADDVHAIAAASDSLPGPLAGGRSIGRRKELRILAAIAEGCREESCAESVVIDGAAGIGKSHLLAELERTVLDPAGYRVLRAACVPLAGERPYELLASFGRSAIEVATDPVEWQSFVTFLERPRSGESVTGGTTSPRTGPRDPELRRRQIVQRFIPMLRSESESRPLALLIDDLQFADRPSIEVLAEAASSLRDAPLLIVQTERSGQASEGRASAHSRGHRVTLRPLSAAAGRELLRASFGAALEASDEAQIAAASGGNPLVLLTLADAVRRGANAVPSAIVAVAQSRLEALPDSARRVLRAASIFGSNIRLPGVQSLLETGARLDMGDELAALCAQGFLEMRESMLGNVEPVYSFASDILREAAYRTLTDEDRVLGHRLAAEWLAGRLLCPPLVLAHHFEHAEEHAAACPYILAAAREALEGNDFEAVAAIVDRLERWARSMPVPAAVLAEGKLLVAEAYKWAGEYARALAEAESSAERADPASPVWVDARVEVMTLALRTAHIDRLRAAANELLERPIDVDDAAAVARAACVACQAGLDPIAESLYARVRGRGEEDPAVASWVHNLRSLWAGRSGDLSASAEHLGLSAEAYERCGDIRRAINAAARRGYRLLCLGEHEGAIAVFERALESARELGIAGLVADVQHNLGWALAVAGRVGDALATERAACVAFEQSGDLRLLAAARLYLARIATMAGESAAADEWVAAARTWAAGHDAGLSAWARAVHAEVALARGDPAPARALAASVVDDRSPAHHEGWALARWAAARGLLATGERADARRIVDSALDELARTAEHIGDAAARARFLAHAFDNRRLRELKDVLTSA